MVTVKLDLKGELGWPTDSHTPCLSVRYPKGLCSTIFVEIGRVVTPCTSNLLRSARILTAAMPFYFRELEMGSATRESNLWKWLMKERREFRDRLHMTRIENSAGKSTPDVEGCLDGVQFWTELKCENLPTHPETPVKPRFQPGQPEWLAKRSRAGGRTWVLLQVGKGRTAQRFLIPGSQAAGLAHGCTVAQMQRLAALDPKSNSNDMILAMADNVENLLL